MERPSVALATFSCKESSIVRVTGPQEGDPVKVGLLQTDLITAMWAAFGIVYALFHRERTSETTAPNSRCTTPRCRS